MSEKFKKTLALFFDELIWGPVGIGAIFAASVLTIGFFIWLLFTFTIILKVFLYLIFGIGLIVSLYLLGKYLYDLWQKCSFEIEQEEQTK